MNTRTWIGIGLFVPLAAVLLATFACLPAPVGDPQGSKVDDQLIGAWQGAPKDATSKEKMLVLLRPWDGKTYYMQYIASDVKDGKEEHQLQHYKCWLTTLAGGTFLTCEPLDNLKDVLAADPGETMYWVVFRLNKTADGMEARMVKPDSDLMKDQKTREQIEAVIKAHLEDASLYGDAISFKKSGAGDRQAIEETLKKAMGGESASSPPPATPATLP